MCKLSLKYLYLSWSESTVKKLNSCSEIKNPMEKVDSSGRFRALSLVLSYSAF